MKKIMVYLGAVTFAITMLITGPSARAATATAATPPQYGPPPPAQANPNEPWAVPDSRWQAVQQRGFRDGVRGARKDAENHRQPNVNNRDEFRHPPVGGPDRQAYREGFRRGYWAGVRHLMGYYRGPYGE